MTPFTDNVDLTAADRRAYADAAQAQRFKGFESVTVRYDDDGQHASARRRARDDAAPPAVVGDPGIATTEPQTTESETTAPETSAPRN